MTSYKEIEKGKYKVFVELGYDDFGKRIRKTKTIQATSNRDLNKKIKEFELNCIAKYETGDIEEINFNYCFDRWWKNHVLLHLSPGSRDGYFYFIDDLIAYFGNMKMKKIKTFHIEEFFIEQRAHKKKSLNNKLSMLKSIFRKARYWGLIDSNPTIDFKLPKEKKIEREIYDKSELKELFVAVGKLRERDRIMIKLAAVGGLRRGEVLGIAFEDIDFTQNGIHITKSLNYDRVLKEKFIGPTKGRKKRFVTFPEQLMKELKVFYFKQREMKLQMGSLWETIDGFDLIFRSRDMSIMHPITFTNQWTKVCKRLGLKPIALHDLRHSSASYLIAGGERVDVVQKRLGHANYETTMNTYNHTNKDDQDKAADVFDDVL
ncbi:hypothetical protein HMPREF1210_01185 [Paenisporosarcina sp. HGH0030]|uniref:tyrosine-type recombinase/integrase n=1 Tax=Paenisporosarcina sp. HGH0030 TaxID=1078085 RepID=UPI00034E4DF7|nr:site-specific integrase [Paenisporosarcina sp. HGH0030]EPD52805.1 hypothetical protein HMPREF1210_01185 [Paenisporosarcina sp. HGH0030]